MHWAWPLTALLLASAFVGGAKAADPVRSTSAVAGGAAEDKDAKRLKAQRELEALLLQTLVASAFKKNDSRLFGAGTAGRQWQAMMTEHVARAMAASGQIRFFPPARGKAASERRSLSPLLPQPPPAAAPSIPGWATVATPENTAGATRAAATDATR